MCVLVYTVVIVHEEVRGQLSAVGSFFPLWILEIKLRIKLVLCSKHFLLLSWLSSLDLGSKKKISV